MTTEATEAPFPWLTAAQVADAIIGRQASTGDDFAAAGIPMMGGCSCTATIAAYNAYPSRAGVWRCADCMEQAGDGYDILGEAVEAHRPRALRPMLALLREVAALIEESPMGEPAHIWKGSPLALDIEQALREAEAGVQDDMPEPDFDALWEQHLHDKQEQRDGGQPDEAR